MAGKKPKSRSGKYWEARLSADTDAVAAEFVASLDVDTPLWRYDITGSIAHARMLCEQKIISRTEFARIKKGLLAIADKIESATPIRATASTSPPAITAAGCGCRTSTASPAT